MPKTIHQRVTFRASPEALFDTYLSSRKHSAATGAAAAMSSTWGHVIALMPARTLP